MSAAFIPLFYLIGLAVNNAEIMTAIYHIIPLILAFLFVLDFRIPKIDVGKMFQKKSKTNIQVEDIPKVD